MDAGNNLNIEDARIAGRDGVALHGGNSVNIYEARNTASVSGEFSKKTTGPIRDQILSQNKSNGNTLEIKTDLAAPTSISSDQGGVLIQGGVVNMRGVQVSAAKDIKIEGTDVNIAAAENRLEVNASESSKGGSFNAIGFHSFGKGINAKLTDKMESSATSLTRTTLNGANVSIAAIGSPGSAGGTLNLAGTTVNTPGTLTLAGDRINLLPQTTETTTRNTSQGGDVAWQKTTDKGTTDQKLNYNQLNVGQLTINANHIQAGLGAKDSVEALGKQPGMDWVNQLQNDPKLKDKVDWVKVEEAHKNWDFRQQGLTPEAAAVVTIVVAYFTAGAASSLGNAAAVGAGQGAATTIAVGTTVTTTTTLTAAGAVISGAVTAGVTALASQATVALINNQGDIGGALRDLGSSASVKNLLTAIVTGGVLGGLNLNPTGLPTAGGGSQEFFAQLGQNLQAGAARAVIGTAINGGSFEENLRDGLKNAILDTVAAQVANQIGDLTKKNVLDDFTNKVAHAVAGCMVGAVRADNAGGCGAGALGAAIGELAAEAYGRQGDTTQFAAMIAGLAVAITGGDAAQINLGSQAGANAASNNFLKHDEAARREALKDKQRKGVPLTASEATELANIEVLDIARDLMFKAACRVAGPDCDTARRVLNSAINSYAGGIGAMQDPRLTQDGNLGINSERDQNIALANDAKYAAQSLWDSFTEFAVPQVGGYVVGGILGAYFNEAKAIYAAIKNSGAEIGPAAVQQAVSASTGAIGSAASVLDKATKESVALIANRQTSGQAYAVAGNAALGLETSGYQNIPAKLSTFPGIQTAKDGTFSIVDKNLFMEGVANAYKNSGQTLNSLTTQQIEKYIASATQFPAMGGVPGLHAEVQAANALYNMMGPTASSQLKGVVVATSKLGASSAAGQQGGAFVACTHCSGILPGEVNVITGRR
jgi:filamentous hemagglutinin